MDQMSLLDLLMSGKRAISVAELTAQIRNLLEGEFCDIWVEGEVSNFKRHSSGHWYFTLKDEQAQLRCASFRNQNLYIRFRPQDGLKVRARGYISVYDPRGEYQLLVNSIEPVGKGALQLAFEQLKAQLMEEGLFDEEQKKPLPRLPLAIGIVTSPTGAAIQDILQILNRRNKTVDLLIYPVRVQGEGAAAEIAEAIAYLNESRNVDVIIVGRGGGSIEDLWPFNEECVARAIFASDIPIISAVGHETDFTIADFVADYRAPTPSAAAEIVVARAEEISALIESYRDALISAFQYQTLQRRNQLATLKASPGFDTMNLLMRRGRQQLDGSTQRLERSARLATRKQREKLSSIAMRLARCDLKSDILAGRNQLQNLDARINLIGRRAISEAGDRLRLSVGKLHALSPLAVLARGYALVWDGQGKLVKESSQVSPGDKVRVKLAQGEMTCIKDLE